MRNWFWFSFLATDGNAYTCLPREDVFITESKESIRGVLFLLVSMFKAMGLWGLGEMTIPLLPRLRLHSVTWLTIYASLLGIPWVPGYQCQLVFN